MADLLRLARGAETIDLQTGSVVRTIDYTPVAPDISVTEYISQLRDGGEVTNVSRRNVTESCELLLAAAAGGDMSDVQAYVRSIETWLREVDERQRRGVGDRLYVEYQPQDSSAVWRSEILAGRVEIDEIFPRWLAEMHVRIVIYWTRRFYWEGAEVELPLMNSNGASYYVGGVTVDNCYDATHDNTIDIDGDDVEGVIPAPCRIEMENIYNDSNRLACLFIGHNVFSNPAAFNHILEGENASGGSTNVSAYASGGKYQRYSWATDVVTTAFTWTLSSTLMGAAAGGRFRLIIRFMETPTLDRNIWFSWRILYRGIRIWESEEIQPSTDYAMSIRDLTSVQLPPWLVDSDYALSNLTLQLCVRKAGGGNVYLDFVQLTPTDSYRTLFHTGWGAEYSQRLVDDGIMDLVYVDSGAGTARAGYMIPRGAPVHLWPNRDQRLYFLQTGSLGDTAEIDRTISVRIYYRPRRLTL